MAAGSIRVPMTASGSPMASSTAIYGILTATGADFDGVINQRGLAPIWNESIKQMPRCPAHFSR